MLTVTDNFMVKKSPILTNREYSNCTVPLQAKVQTGLRFDRLCQPRASFVYKIPYRRARAWPLGRVRRASKGILHTSASSVKI